MKLKNVKYSLFKEDIFWTDLYKKGNISIVKSFLGKDVIAFLRKYDNSPPVFFERILVNFFERESRERQIRRKKMFGQSFLRKIKDGLDINVGVRSGDKGGGVTEGFRVSDKYQE